MGRTKPRAGRNDHLHDSLTLKPLDHDHDHDHDHHQISPPSSSHPQPQPGPTQFLISDVTPKASSHRRAPRSRRSRRPAKKSEPGCSSLGVGSLETDAGSLTIDERGDGPSGSSGVVVVVEELETGTSKDGDTEFDVMERLEELGLGVEEPELSDQQLRTNAQAQEDELLAMKSIYGENFLNLDRHKGLQSFQVNVDLEAPNGITVTAKLESSVDDKNKVNENSDALLYSFEVQYLPPIVLTCLLPQSYPSHQPPYFTISVQWLDPIKISQLSLMLDSIWNEQSGQEVIYQWVEWLSSSSLTYLGFEKEIVLGPYGIRHGEDRRAVSGSVSLDVDIPLMKRYNDERLHENFQQTLHDCCICFEEFPGTEFARLPCHHFFCRKCMKAYSGMHVSEGTVSKLLCPEAKCGGMIPPSLLKRLLNQEEYERWESLTLEKTLASMSDIAYCPRCDMPCIEDEDEHAQCSKCFYSFCTLCRDRRHVGVACMTPEIKLAILQERQDSTMLKEEQRRKELEMINEIMSVKAVLNDSKQCPSCAMAISRTGGCNKMVCLNCNQKFCYLCNKAIDGYEHFRSGKCVLFPNEQAAVREVRFNPLQLLAQVRAQVLAEQSQGQGQNCPSCRQFNAKVGNNNHLFCWACQVHYCYLCHQIVRRSSQHYVPKGCKQHSVG